MEGRFARTENSGGIDNTSFQWNENVENHGYSWNEHSSVVAPTNVPAAKRKKSLVQLTIEALPRLENYRNSRRAAKRPSLGELHGGEENIKVSLKN
ncbi:hypothetical protein NQ314_003861 [Rhamnusium bicolor]|uniref:Uncharacterized protein n=1 Tax=Rhamnusium bicolor TaxID=1586634 RepID=A0AAV8ZL10_9CUCU|nr:hypothetical protein NQ314_003861 [Rhamnusium bicolor]